jgi:hypothetical protein
MWTLCLTAVGQPGNNKAHHRHVVQLPDDATLAELHALASAQVWDASSGVVVRRLAAGVPPRPLLEGADAQGSQTLADAGLRNQDRVLVTLGAVGEGTSPPAKKSSTTTTTTSSSRSGKKNPKKGPSTAATTTATGGRKARKKANKRPRCDETSEEEEEDASQPEGNGVAPTRERSKRKAGQEATDSFAMTMAAQDALAQQQTTAGARKTKSPAKKKASRTGASPAKPPKFTHSAGRRLQDGATVAPKQPRRSQKPAKTSNNEDPSLTLLGTLESKSKGGALLRKGYRRAVENAYEQNRAVARLAAIPRGVSVQREGDTMDETSGGLLKVTFRKGIQGRGDFIEEVDYLPLEVLRNVVAAIHPANPEALRPANLALLSPRVLWSIVYHHPGQTVNDALMTLHPALDWSFLQRRKQELSTKARENRRQEQEDSRQPSNDWEAAAAAIASVEEAMENLQTLEHGQRRSTILQAIEQRSTWQIVTPDEIDEEEIETCLQGGPLWEKLPYTKTELAEKLQRVCKIRNWRELANTEKDTLVAALGLAGDPAYIRSHVQAWLERAQQESLDEIMVEICEGRMDVVEALADSARSATPTELAAWKWIAEELHHELASGFYLDKPEDCPTAIELERFCHHAETCLAQLAWTGAFATPIAAPD